MNSPLHPLPGAKERRRITLSQWSLWMIICHWDKTPYAGQSKFDRGKQPKTAITLGYILFDRPGVAGAVLQTAL